MPFRIGVDLNPLRPPYTGVSNYELWLLDALLALGDDIVFEGFGRLGWNDVDRPFIDECIMRSGKHAQLRGPEAGTRPDRVRRDSTPVERLVRSAPLAHAAAARLRGAAFALSLGSRRLDLFHAFMYRAPMRRPHLAVVPVVYDLSHLRHPDAHPSARIHWMRHVAEACRDAPAVHTISQFSAREIAAEFGIPMERIHVIPPAVSSVFLDDKFADASILSRHGLRSGSYALTVSTLEPRKNLATLLESYQRLTSQERARSPLVIAGAAGWGGVKLEAHPLVVAGEVVLAGYVTDAELAALYRGARVFLYPSIYEGYGMPVIEALSCGALVVASDAASIPEAVGEHGRLIEPLDVDAWTEAVRDALGEDSALSDEQRKSRRKAADAWTWRDAALRTRAMYQHVLS